jgi:predicted RNA binding protein YcfA (HicA-like mRNA interferase family)
MAKHFEKAPKRISPISIVRIIETVALVSISFIASYILFTGRTGTINPFVPALLFSSFMALIILSVHMRTKAKEDTKIIETANRLWLENAITQGSYEDYVWLVTDVLEHEGFSYIPETGNHMHFTRESISYLAVPVRKHPTYILTPQDVMNICDDHRDNTSRSIIICCSCGVDERAYEFAQKHPIQRVYIYEMHDLSEINLEMGHTAPQHQLSNYYEVARYTIANEKKARGTKRKFPPLRYLLTSIMLSIGAAFSPNRQWYIIMAGVSLALFFAFLIFPKLGLLRRQTKAQ